MTMKIRTASENAELDYSLQKLLESPNGLERLATETLPPYIRQTRDYEAFARKVLFNHFITEADTHPIKGEPYIYYPKDLDSHAAIYADDGEVPQYVIEDDGVDVGIFTVASDDTTINLKRLWSRSITTSKEYVNFLVRGSARLRIRNCLLWLIPSLLPTALLRQ
jgi:hypothetical protein